MEGRDWRTRFARCSACARLERIDAPCGGYVHHDAKSGVLLQVEGGSDELAKDISMHIAAMQPRGRCRSTNSIRRWSRRSGRSSIEQAKKEGKPENIIEKMIEGRMRNFYAEHVLAEQPFVKDDKQTVGKVAAAGGMKIEAVRPLATRRNERGRPAGRLTK